ncbi:MAG: sugar ABC transporter permease [Candidatus Promineifilaceae bacterium]
MASSTLDPQTPNKRIRDIGRQLLRVVISVGIAILVFYALRWAVEFMRNPEAPEEFVRDAYTFLGMDDRSQALQLEGLNPTVSKLMIAFIALAVGVVGVWALYWVGNDLVGRFRTKTAEKIRPYIFIVPALAILGIYLVYPAANTIYLSLTEDILNVPEEVPEEMRGSENIGIDLVEAGKNVTFDGYILNSGLLELARITVGERPALLLVAGDTVKVFGLQNYEFAVTDPDMHVAFRNNVIWLLVGTIGSVTLGLLIAAMVDRIRRESLAKSLIFLPLAISFVGASVIWRFVYAWKPPGQPQIGLLNAIVTQFGSDPIPWIIESPINTYAFIYIMIWLQTGFAMVVLSAALKGVPSELMEAARIDGASEIQIFTRITVPYIRGAIITVATTVFIATLKVFDIVYVMTKGQFDTEVIANRMFVEMFNFRNFGRASSLAVILLIVVLPIMLINIRNLRRQGVNQ